MNDEDRILEDIKEILKELDEQGRMKYTQRYMQHSDISVYKHCISVAYTSVELAERFSLNVNRKELIRGALLHDYFLYDWHEKNAGHRFHGFIHAGRALQNAKNDFELTRREENIISRHMFPLNIVPPMCKEAWLVWLAAPATSAIGVTEIRLLTMGIPYSVAILSPVSTRSFAYSVIFL